MDQQYNQPESRKSYEPPQLTTISLRPEEAVLGHCKIAGGAGGPGPGTCTAIVACVSIGS